MQEKNKQIQKNTNLFVDLPILEYIFILSLDLQQTSIYIYIYICQIIWEGTLLMSINRLQIASKYL